MGLVTTRSHQTEKKGAKSAPKRPPYEPIWRLCTQDPRRYRCRSKASVHSDLPILDSKRWHGDPYPLWFSISERLLQVNICQSHRAYIPDQQQGACCQPPEPAAMQAWVKTNTPGKSRATIGTKGPHVKQGLLRLESRTRAFGIHTMNE
jgi:hypothetical protein